jgi:hypothetical protein
MLALRGVNHRSSDSIRGNSMSAEENVKTAEEGYAAFGRGDLPAILELLTDDIEWIEPGPPDVIPAAGAPGRRLSL